MSNDQSKFSSKLPLPDHWGLAKRVPGPPGFPENNDDDDDDSPSHTKEKIESENIIHA